MTQQPFHHVQSLSDGKWEGRAFDLEGKVSGETLAPRLFLDERLSPLLRFFGVLKKIIRSLVYLLYLFPVFIVLKLALRLTPIRFGSLHVADLITVIYVVVLVVFFKLIVIFMVCYAIVGPKSGRKRGFAFTRSLPSGMGGVFGILGRSAPEESSASHLNEMCDSAAADARDKSEVLPPVKRLTRASGFLFPFDARGLAGDTLATETWYFGPSAVIHRVSTHVPLLIRKDGQPPLVIQLARPPLILDSYRSMDPTSRFESYPEELRQKLKKLTSETFKLDGIGGIGALEAWGADLGRETKVEVVAPRVSVIPDLTKLVLGDRTYAPEGFPERRPQPALMLTDTPQNPVLLIVIRD